jgi:hypothetical protein
MISQARSGEIKNSSPTNRRVMTMPSTMMKGEFGALVHTAVLALGSVLARLLGRRPSGGESSATRAE